MFYAPKQYAILVALRRYRRATARQLTDFLGAKAAGSQLAQLEKKGLVVRVGGNGTVFDPWVWAVK